LKGDVNMQDDTPPDDEPDRDEYYNEPDDEGY
jgi:hypothetical protein